MKFVFTSVSSFLLPHSVPPPPQTHFAGDKKREDIGWRRRRGCHVEFNCHYVKCRELPALGFACSSGVFCCGRGRRRGGGPVCLVWFVGCVFFCCVLSARTYPVASPPILLAFLSFELISVDFGNQNGAHYMLGLALQQTHGYAEGIKELERFSCLSTISPTSLPYLRTSRLKTFIQILRIVFEGPSSLYASKMKQATSLQPSSQTRQSVYMKLLPGNYKKTSQMVSSHVENLASYFENSEDDER